jgi:hypothetical protein
VKLEITMTTRTYLGIVHVPADGEHRFEVDPAPITCRLAADQTGGLLSLFESTVPTGTGDLALHTHPGAETFYILDGEWEFTGIDPDGPYTVRARSGDVVHIPAGVPHHFINAGLTTARGLVLRLPGRLPLEP